ncbi:Atu4866 domain-containing protein [Azospirillum sp. ST 5-10]|uniref:Atu4866 domain-containing protein n=1 Tax=unclassified Azospirillum TaxID=2630922 RepID=UPI003F49D1D3
MTAPAPGPAGAPTIAAGTALALVVVAVLATPAPGAARAQPTASPAIPSRSEAPMAQHPYVGMWVTEDGHVRQELLPNGRYDEARGSRKSAYQGRYEITGNRIAYWDDTGFTADGEFRDGVLYHGGMVFHRER